MIATTLFLIIIPENDILISNSEKAPQKVKAS